MKKQKFSFSKRVTSFSFAFKGLRVLFKEEHNSWMHLFLTGVVLILAISFKISTIEWALLVFATGFVFVSEILNSAIENLCNFMSPEKNEQIGRVKDLAAGAVLFSALTSFAVGVIIFLPKIIALF
tara:strand:+ start:12017 stop:12394 length:378 start_codon:yes stop_codon:yes gene_type:complete